MNLTNLIKYLPILKEAGMLAFQMIKLRLVTIVQGPIIRVQDMAKLISKEAPKYTLLDSQYHLVAKKDINLMFNVNLAQYLKYRVEAFDCDDFARTAGVLVRIAFGNVAVGDAIIKYSDGSRHMLNVIVTANKEIVYIEPQNNKIVDKNFTVEEIRI